MNRNLSRPTRPVKSRSPRQRRRSHRPALTVLEDRTLPSVTSTLFALVPAQSSLTLSGTINGSNISQQGAGSLTTTYSGTVAADWDLDARTIRFNSAGTAATAANSGSWQPNVGGGGGSAPANYGAQGSFSISICSISARVAVRGLVASLSTAGTLPLTASGSDPYTFASTQTLAINAGGADYSYSTNFCGSGSGHTNIAGQSTANTASARGVFQDLGNGAYGMTIPVSVTINQNISTPLGNVPVVLHINGSMRANATLPVVSLGAAVGSNYATSAVATQGPVRITDPAARVTDAGTSTLRSLTATLTNHPDGAQERLAADLTGTGLSGSYNSATGVESITGNASPAVYTTALGRLTYQNDQLRPDTHDRVIQVVVGDGTNVSVVRTSTVTVFAPATSLAVAGFPSPVTAGTAGTFTVTARDANGNAAPGYTGTVHFTSSDPQAVAGNGLPNDYTFVAGDHGVHTFSATLKTAGPSQSITATDRTTMSITGTQSGIVVNPAAADHFAVATTAANPDVAGTTFDVSVTVKDAFNNTVTGYGGTITFSTMDPSGGSFSPPSYTFVAADNGTHTFPGGATLYTAGTWDVTAADAGGVTGSANVNVVAGPAAAFSIAVPDSVSSGAPFRVTVSAVDPYGNVDTRYVTDPSGVVTFFTTTDSDPGVMLPPDSQFAATDMGTRSFDGVIYITPGAQDLWAYDTVSGIYGVTTVNVTAAPPAFGGGSAAGLAPAVLGTRAQASSTAPAPVVVQGGRALGRAADAGATDVVLAEMARRPSGTMAYGSVAAQARVGPWADPFDALRLEDLLTI
jgi:hypothetical protein